MQVAFLETPSLWIIGALVAYGFAYYVYAKWVDEHIWEVSEKRVTPAHMYLDGVEYFPVSRYVLYGFQFKSIAALGPILGPFIAVAYGWLPALIWIVIGNMFIGWVQDYSTIMLTVRNEGRSMGPLVYNAIGERGRKILLAYLLFYLLIISAVFIYLVSLFWNVFPGSFIATIGIIITGLIVGELLYKYKANIFGVTALAIILTLISVGIGTVVAWPPKDFFGPWSIQVWSIILAIILFVGAIVPLPKFITPMNFVAVFPAIGGVLLIIFGALISPATGIKLIQPAFKGWYVENVGPIFPILFVSIACGAISGWHSLVSTSTTGKQLDVETDARPVGAGAMLTEGLLATSALAAYMVVSPDLIAKGKISAFVNGATLLTAPFLGGDASKAYLLTFFSIFLVIYAITVQALVTRYWRVFSAELFRGSWEWLGNKYIATVIGLILPIIFALTGSWINLWIYFGGSNQLLAAMALTLVAFYVAKMNKPSWYSAVPAAFMTIVTLSALLWEIYTFGLSTFGIKKPLAKPPLTQYPGAAWALNALFFVIGIVLFVLGIYMSYALWSAYFKVRKGEVEAKAVSP